MQYAKLKPPDEAMGVVIAQLVSTPRTAYAACCAANLSTCVRARRQSDGTRTATPGEVKSGKTVIKLLSDKQQKNTQRAQLSLTTPPPFSSVNTFSRIEGEAAMEGCYFHKSQKLAWKYMAGRTEMGKGGRGQQLFLKTTCVNRSRDACVVDGEKFVFSWILSFHL